MIGNNANNASALAVSLGTVGQTSTLILPVQFQTTGGSGRIENWVGQLVAVAQIPEPSGIALVLAGLGLLAVKARRNS